MSVSNNFKDDFENRQSIDTNQHEDKSEHHTEEHTTNEKEQVQENLDNNQQFPPRNAQRRQRKRQRNTKSNQDKQVHNYNEKTIKTIKRKMKDNHHMIQLNRNKKQSQQNTKMRILRTVKVRPVQVLAQQVMIIRNQ